MELFTPGNIIHLVRTEQRAMYKRGKSSSFDIELKDEIGLSSSADTDGSSSQKKKKKKDQYGLYTARWAKKEDFKSVVLSSRLMSDHDPIQVKNQLRALAQNHFGLSSNNISPPSLDNLDNKLAENEP